MEAPPEERQLTVRAHYSEDFKTTKEYELKKCNLKTTLGKIKAMIRKKKGITDDDATIFLHYHQGEAIDRPDCMTISEVFDCSENVNGEIIIDLDFSTPTFAVVKISYKGKREKIHIVDCENKRVEVGRSDVSANLQDLNRWALVGRMGYPGKMKFIIVDKDLGVDQLAVMKFEVEGNGPFTISDNESSFAVTCDGGEPVKKHVLQAYQREEGKFWLFSQREEDTTKFVEKDEEPVLNNPISVDNEFWNRDHMQINKDMVTKALDCSLKTYADDNKTWVETNPMDLEEGAKREKVALGKGKYSTRCVVDFYPKANGGSLYIGCRGTANLNDWRTNANFMLDPETAEKVPRTHRGFTNRSDSIFEELVPKLYALIRRYNWSVSKIITCGHSLGSALSQLIHIKLKEKEEFEAKKLINITFAPPMVGNVNLRKTLNGVDGNGVASSMYHFVVAEDIVPASLFTEYTKEKIHLYEWLLNWAVRKGLGTENTNDEDANLPEEVIAMLKKTGPVTHRQPVFDEEHALDQYAPVGTHFYIKGDAVYEMKHDDDPQYIARAMIEALKALDNVRVPYVDMPGMTGHKAAWREATKIVKHHSLQNYKTKLGDTGLVKRPESE